MRNIILILLLLSITFNLSAKNRDSIKYNNINISKTGDTVNISFVLSTQHRSVLRNEKLSLIPVLYNNKQSITLPSIIIQERRMNWIDFREGKNISKTSYYTGNNGKIEYVASIPYNEGLNNVFLRLDSYRTQCCKKEILASISLVDSAVLVNIIAPDKETQIIKQVASTADSLAVLYPFIAPLSDFENNKQTQGSGLFNMDMPLNMGKGESQIQQNAVEKFVADNEDGAIMINFSRNSSIINRYYAKNNTSLVLLASALKQIQASNNSRVEKIIVSGFASPEGPLKENDRLAWERADAVRSFICNNSNIKFKDILLYNGSEDWRGLRELVEQSDIEGKYDILYIIDNVPILNGREKKLMDLYGGKPFKYMERNFFPKLRNAAYIKVYYVNTNLK